MLNLNFQNGQAPALNARNMNAIVESINALGYAVGGPNVASTVSAMTDTSKVYVYTGSETGYTAGNWYYYNGSAWVSGGVYQATAVETDTTLTIPGEPADAKATGDAVADLKSALSGETDNVLVFNANWKNNDVSYVKRDETIVSGTKGNSATFVATYHANVKPNTNYIFNYSGNSVDLYVYSDQLYGTLIKRLRDNDRIFNSGENSYIYVGVFALSGYTDFEIKEVQIVEGTIVPKYYAPHLSAKDYVARGKLDNIIPENYVTPEMYGAVGDGENDDTTAVQAAINSGRAVYFEKEIYKVSEIVVTDVIIIGNKTHIAGNVTINEDVYASQLLFDNVTITNASTTRTFININISDCAFIGSDGDGLTIASSETVVGLFGVTVKNCYFTGTYDNAILIHTILYNDALRWITRLTFDNVFIANCAVGIYGKVTGTPQSSYEANADFYFNNIYMQHYNNVDRVMFKFDACTRCNINNAIYYDNTTGFIVDVPQTWNSRVNTFFIKNVSGPLFDSSKVSLPYAYDSMVLSTKNDYLKQQELLLSGLPPTFPLAHTHRTDKINKNFTQANIITRAEGINIILSNIHQYSHPFNVFFGVDNRNFPVYGHIDGGPDLVIYHIYSEKYMPLLSNGIPSYPVKGYMLFDDTNNRPIWYSGTGWVDAMGNEVDIA